MLKKTKVYWAYCPVNNLSDIVGFPPERLISSMKADEFWSGSMHGHLLQCPSTLDMIRNTYLIKSSLNAKFSVKGDAICSDYGGVIGRVDEYLQLHLVLGFLFFSESSVNLTVTPPHFHHECMAGVSGAFDISRWLRPVGPSISMKKRSEVQIIHGQPVMYVDFDRSVELVQFRPTNDVLQIANKSASLKTNVAKTPLSDLYRMFERNKLNRFVLREIKNNLL
jgi:hypothetical protein